MSKENRKLYIAKFDEINAISKQMYDDYISGKKTESETESDFEDFLLYAYSIGFLMGAEDIGASKEQREEYMSILLGNSKRENIPSDVNGEDTYESGMLSNVSSYALPISQPVKDAVERKFEGITAKQRLKDHLLNRDGASSIERLMNTEWHRMTNEGINGFGNLYGMPNITKHWVTMRDDKVRDTHDYLEGTEVPFNEDFYTYNGDHAPFPVMFGVPEEDVNCRCIVELRQAK